MRGTRLSVVLVALTCIAAAASAEPASTSRLTWVTNGTVRAAAVHDQTLYIGGTFTRVAPAANFLGPWFGVSTTTGAALPRLPLADGAVLAIEADGAGGYFVGGRFTRIGGVPRTALAHVLADGTVDPAFAPILAPAFPLGFDQPTVLDVRTIVRVGDVVLVGGSFRAADGAVTRDGFAAFHPATGVLRGDFGNPAGTPAGSLLAHKILVDGASVFALGESRAFPVPGPSIVAMGLRGIPFWIRSINGTVFDAVVAGGRLVVAGTFLLTDGAAEIRNLASLNPVTGALDTAWQPIPLTLPPSSVRLLAVAAIGSTVYVGGEFGQLGTMPRANLAAVDLDTGTLTGWAPATDGTVRDLVPSPTGSLYVAGEFQRAGGQPRSALAEIDTAGAVTAWTPQAHATGIATLRVTAGVVLAGGSSAVAGGVPRDRLAAFSLVADDVLPWAPVNPHQVVELVTDGARVFVLRLQPRDGILRTTAAAFEASGAESGWTGHPDAVRLLAVFDGYVYLNVWGNTPVSAPAAIRVDAVTGTPDPSWRLDIGVNRLLPSGERVYLIDPSSNVHNELREHLAVLDRATGAVGPWNPTVLPTAPGGPTLVLDAALDGQTMYVAHRHSITRAHGITGIDTDSGVAVGTFPPPPFPAERLATADGLLFAIGIPASRGATAVASFRADGTSSGWSPGLVLSDVDALEPEYTERRRPSVLATPTDLVVTGIQALDGAAPVHGIAVFARNPPAAPGALDAEVVENAVRLTWTPPVPSPASYVIEAGSSPGARDLLVQDTGSGAPALDASAPWGTYFVRVRAAGVIPGAPEAVPTNEIAVRVGCVAPPAPPLHLSATLSGTTVTLQWAAPALTAVSRYVIEAGSGPGLANLARLVVPASGTTFTTTAPPGTYHVRVRAENACGPSRPTPDIWLAVGGGDLPPAPASLTVTELTPGLPAGTPRQYRVDWSPVPGATAYLLEAGSRPGLADLASVILPGTSLGPAGAAWGWSHFVRVRAVNEAGVGPPSAEYVVIVR